MASNSLSPFVYWGQTGKIITLKVDLRKVENLEVLLTEESLRFSADGLGVKGLHKYEFELDFYLSVNPEKSQYRKTDLAVEFQIMKTAPETWPRLSAQKVKLHWLKIDFDKFMVDESETSDVDNDQSQENLINKIVTEMGNPSQREGGGFPSIKKSYLIFYNLFQFIGFTYIVGALLMSYIRYGETSKEGAFETVGSQLMVCQIATVLEVFHAAFGLVKSSIVSTILQVTGRNFVLFALILQEPRLQLSSYCFYIFLVWASIEIVRYPFYLLQLFGMKVKVLTWLRYTIWIPLYPLGILLEACVILNAIQYFQDTGYFSFQLPNSANFAFYFPYFLMFYLVLISFGATSNLNYMRIQRQKQLSGGRATNDVRKKM